MISTAELLLKEFLERDINFFAGVPDSLLKSFSIELDAHSTHLEHIIAPNEGAAVALAAGHYLSSSSAAVVYLQNSGLGNTLNPLISLCDSQVYSIPLILLIGWRGEPGVEDEPQHLKQGELTLPLLDLLGIPSFILNRTEQKYGSVVDKAVEYTKLRQSPVAIVVQSGVLQTQKKLKQDRKFGLTREKAIELIIGSSVKGDFFVSTTGMISRELFEIRSAQGEGIGREFLMVGSMGYASSITLALALRHPDKRFICLDGDGSLFMHQGTMALIGQSNACNLIHIVLNNGAHDSVGGQKTCALEIDLCQIAKGFGYEQVFRVNSSIDLGSLLQEVDRGMTGSTFIEIRVDCGSRSDLGRPSMTPIENRDVFMNHLLRD